MEQEQNTNSTQSHASLVWGIAIVVVLVLLGWFLFRGREEAAVIPPIETASQEQSAPVDADAATAALTTQGTSDEVSALDQDLNATDLNALDDVNKI